MNIVNADAKYLNPNDMHPYQFMELVGRTCYKSEDKITDVSAPKFVKALAERGHTAMLEHAHIILKLDNTTMIQLSALFNDEAEHTVSNNNNAVPLRNHFNITNTMEARILSGSFRSFINLFNNELIGNHIVCITLRHYLNEKYPEIFETKDAEKAYIDKKLNIEMISRDELIELANNVYKKDAAINVIKTHIVHTIVFTCDRGVTHEFVRHRPASFAQESTRYCNYSYDKFGKEITVIKPCFWDDDSKQMKLWKKACDAAESAYFDLLISGATPQQARDVLPTSVKTELVITANEHEWQHIINLRYHGTTGAPHPQMVECMTIAVPFLFKESDNRLK